MSTIQLFPETRRFKSFISLLNSISSEALPKLQLALTKVAVTVVGASASSTSGLRAFTDEEEVQLVSLFSLPSRSELLILLEGSAFIFETAALHNLKSASLGQALLSAGVSEAAAVSVVGVWSAESSNILNRLRAMSKDAGAPQQLLGSTWRISLGLGHSGQVFGTAAQAGRENGAGLAAFELTLGSSNNCAGPSEDDTSTRRTVTLDMDKAQLLNLLEKLDAIQAQLDVIS
jgi:hypothetical protein